MVGKSKLPLGSTTVFSETDENGLPTTSNGGASAVGNSVSGGSTQKPATQTTGTKQTANAGSQEDIPSLTYDEIQAFANQPQAPNDDISGGKNKTATNTNANTNNDDDDGESDVKDEAKANNIANNGMAATPNTPWGNGSFYDWYAKQLEPYKPLSAEELEKERKRQKRKELFAAIGDGLSALSNIFFTTQGAPNMDDGKNTLSAAAQARYDKMKAEREANNKYYMNGWWNLMRQKRADETAEQNAQYKKSLIGLRQQDTQMKLKKYQSEIDKLVEQGKTEEAQQKYLEAQTLYYQSKAEGQDIANEWAPKLNQGKLNLQGAQTKAANSRAHASEASANNSNAKAEATRQKNGSGGPSQGKSGGEGKKSQPSSGGGTQNKSASSGGSYTNTKKLGL